MFNLTEFPNGLTIRELKEIIKSWPEEYEDGSQCEVYISCDNGNLSSQVSVVCRLNTDESGASDLYIG